MSPIFEALADPTRQRILALLLSGERPVGELVDALGVAQPSVSKHLAKLKAAGLVAQRAEAQKRHYRLTPEPLRALEGWLEPYLGGAPEKPAVVEDNGVVLTSRSLGPQGWTLGFETYVEAPASEVWAALTQPGRIEAWLGKAMVEPNESRYRLTFTGLPMMMGGRILAWAPPRRLECRLRVNPRDEGPVTAVVFDLPEERDGVRLCVTQKGVPAAMAGLMAAVWHSHLERLAPALRGETPAWDPRRLEALSARYSGVLAG